MIRRKIPSTAVSMLKIFVFRCRSAGVSAARAPFTAASERFSQRIGSALEVTVVPIPSVRSGDILGPIAFSIRKFARTMCIYTSLVERTPVAGRHANFSGGVARLTARTRDSIRPRIPETHQAPLERTTSKCSLITTATRLLPTLFSFHRAVPPMRSRCTSTGLDGCPLQTLKITAPTRQENPPYRSKAAPGAADSSCKYE